MDLADFTDMSKVPAFNSRIKWKRYQDKLPRRTNNQWEDPGQRPSTLGQSYTKKTHSNTARSKGDNDTNSGNPAGRQQEDSNPLVRANSNSLTSAPKKSKLYSAESSAEEEEDPLNVENDMEFSSPTRISE